jgi:hypothetical protein
MVSLAGTPLGASAFWTSAALASVIASLVGALVAAFVARHQARSAAIREMHDRQSDLSLDISKLLLDPDKARAAARRFAVAVVKVIKSSEINKKGLVLFIPHNSRVTIGREDTNDIVLDDDEVSRFHCGIVADGKDAFLEDYCSTNGVELNGSRIQSGQTVRLSDGDKLVIGSYAMRFQTVHRSEVLSR